MTESVPRGDAARAAAGNGPAGAAARNGPAGAAGHDAAGTVGGDTAGTAAGDASRGVAGRTVIVAGASSESGHAVSAALLSAGARVVAISSGREGLDALAAQVPGVDPRQCDLADTEAVAELAEELRIRYGGIDGVIHLVGGWRGGGGLPGQSDADWAILDRSFATLRVVTREFYGDLLASPAGRLAIVSSTSVESPRPGGANYAAAKAAAETWVRAIASGFVKEGGTAAAAIFVVTTLAGLEPELAARTVGLWSRPAAELNGARIPLLAA